MKLGYDIGIAAAAKARNEESGSRIDAHLTFVQDHLSGACYTLYTPDLTQECLLIELNSETAFSIDTAIQVDAPVRRRNSRLGRKMGIQFVLVFSYPLWSAASLQLHPWQ